jgi:uncharacterized protein (DUF2235 family)
VPKNILIFADGTGQVGGVRPDQQLSNIYKLFRATRVGPDSPIDPKDQVAYYDPGLGTAAASGSVRLSPWQRMNSLAGLAVGLGFSGNVIDCYEAILKRYEPGDRIYLFGFSRGGYTVRALANVLNLCGVPTTDGAGGPLPRAGKRLRAIAREAVMRVYEHGAGHERKKFYAQREAIAQKFRTKYRSGTDPNRADVYPEFVGVFDAVASLGLPSHLRTALLVGSAIAVGFVAWFMTRLTGPWFGWPTWIAIAAAIGAVGLIAALAYGWITFRWAPKAVREGLRSWHFALWRSKHYDRYLDPRIPVVRHALAIDETREHFGRVEWGGAVNADRPGDARGHFRQRWFAGNHSGIGGSYPEDESRLSDIALAWMVEEATQPPHPILIDGRKLILYPDPRGPQHSEVFAQQQERWWKRIVPWPTKPRVIDKYHGDLDESVLARFRATCVADCDQQIPYRPQALSEHHKVSHYYKAGDIGPGCENA